MGVPISPTSMTDHEGVEAILETYNRLYDQWKDNSIYIKELMLVLNHRCTYWNNEITKDSKNRKAIKYAQIYWDLFEKMDEDWGYTYLTNFHEEFDNADHIGIEAIRETYDRLVKKWKDNPLYIKEIKLILNHRCTYWNEITSKNPKNQNAIDYSVFYWHLYIELKNLVGERYDLVKPLTKIDWKILE